MLKILIILALVWVFDVHASATRVLEADTITSSDKTKTFTMPAATGTLQIGGQLAIASQFVRDSYAGDGSTTIFTLSFTPAVNAQVEVFVDGLLRILTTDYSISGTSLTFVSAPILGQDIKVIYSKY